MSMEFIRKKVLTGELAIGTWLNLGSPLTAEMAGLAGFDWALIDLEHGSGSEIELLHQLQALAGTPAAPLVRIAWNEAPRFKRVLDMGAAGVMVPYVNNASEAALAAAAMRYPPLGVRGTATSPRACGFGVDFEDYFTTANDNVLTIVQIETGEALNNAEEIAAVDGVDVLFVGPLDLSINLGIRQQLDHPAFREAVARIVGACRNNGKAAGTVLRSAESLEQAIRDGYTFIGIGSDGGIVATAMRKLAGAVAETRKKMTDGGSRGAQRRESLQQHD